MDKFNESLSDFIDSFYKKDITRKVGRPSKFKTIFYVEQITYVLQTGLSWNKLKPQYKNKTCTGNAIYKKFIKWTKDNIFEKFYYQYYKKYRTKFSKCKNFFLDSTVIKNGNNSKNTGYSPKIKSKKSIKLSVICDENGIISDMHVSKSNIHDSKLITPVIKNTIKDSKTTNLIADMGYISNKKTLDKLKKMKIKLITPVRNNMKRKLSQSSKKLLKKRGIIERVFSYLKRGCKKINIIYERNICNYFSWLFIGASYGIFKFLNT